MNVLIAFLSAAANEQGLKNSGLNEDSNPVLCDARAVLHQKVSESSLQELLKTFIILSFLMSVF